jgi:hypothetical protein
MPIALDPAALSAAALDYASRGWYVFPVWSIHNGGCACGKPGCSSPGKHPIGILLPHGVLDASCDPVLIMSWWKRFPTANIGLACGPSGLYVVDVDAKGATNGYATWAALKALHSIDDQTPTFLTGSGGIHMLYSVPPGDTLGNTAGKLGPGLDTRGAGGYIVVPPSRHISGGMYSIDPTWNLSIPVLPLPDVLRGLLTTPQAPRSYTMPPGNNGHGPPSYGAAALRAELDNLAQAVLGTRNDTLNRSAFALGQLVAGGELAQAEVETGLLATARGIGLDDTEAVPVIQRGIAAGSAQPRSAPAQTINTGLGGGLIGAPLGQSQGQSPSATALPLNPTVKKSPPKSRDYLNALAIMGYSFRMNVLADVIEVNGVPLTDAIAAKIRAQMRDRGFSQINAFEDAYTAEAYDNRYHPITQYLDGLAWDGGNHIAALASHFTDKESVFPLYLRKWLIGAVAKARTGKQNVMLVMEGAQNIGKSFLTEWLGGVLGPGYYFEGSLNPEDKDALVRLASVWVWQVSELGATTRKADREMMKQFLSQSNVTVRKAYGRYDIHKPALASFIGTLNKEGGFLNDPTGSRRFVTATFTAIDWSYSDTLNPNQVWAEANAAYQMGEPWTLNAVEFAMSEQINRGHEVDNPMEGLLLKYFHVDENLPTWTPSIEILTTLQLNGWRGASRADAMELSAVMTKLQIERRKGHNANGQRVWGYSGVEAI